MTIFRLKITLEGTAPVISRTLEVPKSLRLDRLHTTIQAAMGWENYHLFEFRAGGRRWGTVDPEYPDDTLPAAKATIADLSDAVGKSAVQYVYDFGDNWVHSLELVEGGDAMPEHLYPRLLEVAGRCPPEDVGGVSGYESFLAAIGNPKHPEHSDMLRWHGGPFDRVVADEDEHRLEVLRLAKRWKPRAR